MRRPKQVDRGYRGYGRGEIVVWEVYRGVGGNEMVWEGRVEEGEAGGRSQDTREDTNGFLSCGQCFP